MIDRFLGDVLVVFSCLFWSTVLLCCARLPIHTSNYCTARFISMGVFECGISHRRSVATLCVLYKIRCNPTHSLNGAFPGPCVSVLIARSALVAHRYTYAPPRCRTSQYLRTFISSQCPSGTILQALSSMVWDSRVSRAGELLFIGLSSSIPTIVFYYFSLSSFCL